jgi:K+-transporting ATPase ATPase A chain
LNLYSLIQYLLFLVIVTAFVKPLGGYMEKVLSGKRTSLDRLCLPVERETTNSQSAEERHDAEIRSRNRNTYDCCDDISRCGSGTG